MNARIVFIDRNALLAGLQQQPQADLTGRR